MQVKIDNLFSVRGKAAVITGGATGIGRMIAQGLVENGARVYIASRKLDVCEQTARELSAFGSCTALEVDLASTSSLNAFAGQIAIREPKLHILINNSGARAAYPIAEFPEGEWDNVMAINVKAPFFLVKALLPQLKAAGTSEDPSRIINIGSTAGIETLYSDNFAYGPSKAAVHHLTHGLASKLAEHHITVNAIAPGAFPSVLMGAGEKLDHYVKQAPLARAGTMADVAGTVLYLCSRAGAYTTGVVLPVDGGRVLGGTRAANAPSSPVPGGGLRT